MAGVGRLSINQFNLPTHYIQSHSSSLEVRVLLIRLVGFWHAWIIFLKEREREGE